MLDVERQEAVGSRGEACIIVRTAERPPSLDAAKTLDAAPCSYRLATGERLLQTDDAQVFETLDGQRRFTLRSGRRK
jgi:hypothetical protein